MPSYYSSGKDMVHEQMSADIQWHCIYVTGPRPPSAALSVVSPPPRSIYVLLRATHLDHKELYSPRFRCELSITCLNLNLPLYLFDPKSEKTNACF